MEASNQQPIVNYKFAKIVIGVLLFGILMGIRDEFTETWLRVLIVIAAGGFFGWMMVTSHKRTI